MIHYVDAQRGDEQIVVLGGRTQFHAGGVQNVVVVGELLEDREEAVVLAELRDVRLALQTNSLLP